MTEVVLLRPWLLLLFPALGLLMMAQRRLNSKPQQFKAIVDSQLQPFVLATHTQARNVQWLVLTQLAVAILALSGPAIKNVDTPVFKHADALVILLHLGHEMNATDVAPSRMQQALFKLRDLLSMREDGYTALVVYAGEAFMVSPLTHDVHTITNHFKWMKPSVMPVDGNNLQAAVDLGAQLLDHSELTGGAMLALTHSSNQSNIQSPYPLHILGVGTQSGGPVPLGDGNYATQLDGSIRITRFDALKLKRIAERNQGRLIAMTTDQSDLQALQHQLARSARTTLESNQHNLALSSVSLGPWLLIPLLLMVLPGFRKGWLP